MGQKVKHRKQAKCTEAFCIGNIYPIPSNKEIQPSPYSSAYAAKLTQAELSQYLHRIITSNLPYYTALARYRNKPFHVPRHRLDWKNHQLLSRLTVSGLTILKTQFAKKPKNPV